MANGLCARTTPIVCSKFVGRNGKSSNESPTNSLHCHCASTCPNNELKANDYCSVYRYAFREPIERAAAPQTACGIISRTLASHDYNSAWQMTLILQLHAMPLSSRVKLQGSIRDSPKTANWPRAAAASVRCRLRDKVH